MMNQGHKHKETYVMRAESGQAAFVLLVFFSVSALISAGLIVAIGIHQNYAPWLIAAMAFVFVMLSVLPFAFRKMLLQGTGGVHHALLNEVMEGSRGARLITDASNETVYTNQKFTQLCTTHGEASLQTLAGFFANTDYAKKSFDELAEQAKIGETGSIELPAKLAGKEKWFLVTAQPIAGWAGYIHWRIDDVTEPKLMELSVDAEREKLIDFTDNAPVGFFSVDEDGRFIFVNATLARWLGTDIEMLLNEGRLHTFMVDPPENGRPYDLVEDGGAKQVCEVQMKGPAGRTFLASVSQLVVHEDDKHVRTRAVVHDLTSEREMHRALQASEHRFQKFYEEAPLGIALLEAGGVLGDCNPAFAEMLDAKASVIVGMQMEDMIVEEDRRRVIDALSHVSDSTRNMAPIEVTLTLAGKNVVTQLYARKFGSSDNTVLHFIDLTEQKNLELQFAQSQKMQAVGQLAGGVAHDFNNLLTAMIGFCDLLLLRHKPGDSSFGDIMQIKQNANRASNLVRQLLAFSRQQTLQPRVLDLSDVLTELSHLLRRLIGVNIELEVRHGADLGLVKADQGQLEQVLINLAVNARDAMDDKGSLTIATENYSTKKPVECMGDTMPPGHWVQISVMDTGCGIPEENLSRILEPFFSTKEVGQGTGLGLSTVYGIIRQTGGYLRIDSAVDKGATFMIFLPRHIPGEQDEEDIVALPEDDDTRDLTGSATILLVEDEDAVRTFSARALTNKGYTVLEADNGEAALDLIAREKPTLDLLITDVIMPNMDGPTLAKKMLQDIPDLKIIFISGYTEDKFKHELGENVKFLPKPFTLKQLAAKVKDTFDE